jgi:hypothetical protein
MKHGYAKQCGVKHVIIESITYVATMVPFYSLFAAIAHTLPGSLHIEQQQEVQRERWVQVQGYVLCDHQVREGVVSDASPADTSKVGQVRYSHPTSH